MADALLAAAATILVSGVLCLWLAAFLGWVIRTAKRDALKHYRNRKRHARFMRRLRDPAIRRK